MISRRVEDSTRKSPKPLSIRTYKIDTHIHSVVVGHRCRFNQQTPDLESLMSDLYCPTCGASKIRLAVRKSLSDILLSGLTIYPFRCQLCADRFRTFLGRRTPNPRCSVEHIEVSFLVWSRSHRSTPVEMGHEGVIDEYENFIGAACVAAKGGRYAVSLRERGRACELS